MFFFLEFFIMPSFSAITIPLSDKNNKYLHRKNRQKTGLQAEVLNVNKIK